MINLDSMPDAVRQVVKDLQAQVAIQDFIIKQQKEEIRLLTNLETSQQKLLQIILAGQPELDQKLDSYGLRQLKQRVAMRCHLESLTLLETGQ